MKRVLSYILSFVIAILLVALTIIIIVSTTILNSKFLLKTLEKCNYYELIDTNIKSGIEGYIKQSGLEEDVFDEIYTQEELKNDINRVVTGLYRSEESSVDESSVKENLEKNIEEYLNSNNIDLNETQRKNIDGFVEKITSIYVNEISHPVYFETARAAITIISKFMPTVRICVIVALVVLIAVLAVLNIKEPLKILKYIAISFLTLSLSILVSFAILKGRINIEHILILNVSFTLLITNIIKQIARNFLITAIVAATIAIGLIATSKISIKNNTKI